MIQLRTNLSIKSQTRTIRSKESESIINVSHKKLLNRTIDEIAYPIKDRGMWTTEYQKAKEVLPKLRLAAKDPRFFAEFLEALVTVKGHAWCMDVKSERHKMAKLISREIISMGIKYPHEATFP